MRKPNFARKGAEFSSLAKKTGGMFVFSSLDSNFPHQENAFKTVAGASYEKASCKTCGSVFDSKKAQTAGYHPHCVACGSEDVDILGDSTPILPTSDDELSAVQCGLCHTTHVMKAEISSLKKVHCSACGTGIRIVADTDDIPSTPDNTDDVDLMDMEEELLANDEEQDPGSDENPALISTDDVEQIVDPAAVSESEYASEEGPSTQGPTGEIVDTMEFDISDCGVGFEPGENPDAPVQEISFSYGEKKMRLLRGDVIVATLTEETAGDNAPHMFSDNFRLAIAKVIQKDGLKKAIAAFKFTPVKITVPVSKAVQAKVDTKLKAETAAVTKQMDSYQESFQQALDIATAGVIQGFFRDKPDLVQTAMVSELATLGIPNPKKVVSRIFAEHALANATQIVELARELAGKDVESLNTLAKSIDLVKFRSAEQAAEEDEYIDGAEGEDDEDEDDTSETAHFQVARAVQPRTHGPAKVTSSLYSGKPEIAKIMGDSPLFSFTS